MQRRSVIFALILGCFLFTACREFIEPSVSEAKVVLLAPADNYESSKYSQNFWWEPVEDALNYRLQVVTPSFDSIGALILDTLVSSDKFIYTLDPGRYQWRVRAENGSSRSLYTTRAFVIHESSIKNQQVQLKAPVNNAATNQDEMTFKWDGLFGASYYRLQIDTNNFTNDSILFFNSTTPNTQFTVSFSRDKQYQWRVRAENDSIVSRWSVLQQLVRDATPPEKVIQLSPENNSIVSKPVTLRWSAVAEVKKYELIVYKPDGSTVYNSTFPLMLTAANYVFSAGSFNETLYWKVRAIDGAGNAGTYSELRNFTIQ